MTIICVDDEVLVLELTATLCRQLPGVDRVESFTYAGETLEWLRDNDADVAVIDVDLPDMNGLVLAKRIKEMGRRTAIIFLTGYSEFAVGAFKLKASGYLMKPVNAARLAEEVEYAMSGIKPEEPSRIKVQTFGNFEIIVDGHTLSFSRSRAKELLAFLVDRQGGGVTRAEAFAALWEDAEYDRPMQKQFDVIVRSMKDALQKAGIEDILEIHGGSMRICPEMLDCDLYRFLAGDPDAENAYRGEYMSAYPWAGMTEGYLEEKQQAKQKNRI